MADRPEVRDPLNSHHYWLPSDVGQVLLPGIEPLSKTFPTPAGEIGFQHGRLHSFRHFFCSLCFLGGVSEGEIQEWLGHADSKMVEHYRHLRSEDAQRTMSQIRFLERAEGRPVAFDPVSPASMPASAS